jgi:hypothetical protein
MRWQRCRKPATFVSHKLGHKPRGRRVVRAQAMCLPRQDVVAFF